MVSDYIDEVNMWFMDVPALSEMLTNTGSPAVFGYFGSDHVLNMLPIFQKLTDGDCEIVAHSGNGVELPSHLQVEINERFVSH
jgi:hypothetical protein